MALIKTAPIVANIRGSIAGMTFSRARSGLVVRSNPFQRRVPGSRPPFDGMYSHSHPSFRRANFSTLSAYWRTDLSQAERDAWDALAVTTRLVSRLGDPYQPTGRALFLRLNVLWTLFGAAPIATAPARAVGQLPPIAATWNAGTQDFTLSLTHSYLDPGDMVYIWFSPPRNKTVNVHSYPYYLDSGPDANRFPIRISLDPRGLDWVCCMAYFLRARVVALDHSVSYPVTIRAISE